MRARCSGVDDLGDSSLLAVAQDIGVEFQGAGVFGHGAIDLAQAHPGFRQVEVGGGNRLIQRQRLLEVADSRLVLLVQQGHGSQVVHRGNELRVVLQRQRKVFARRPSLSSWSSAMPSLL